MASNAKTSRASPQVRESRDLLLEFGDYPGG